MLAFETAYRLEQRGARAPRSVIAPGRRGPATRRDEAVHKTSASRPGQKFTIGLTSAQALINTGYMVIALVPLR
ncbi:alpha/beta hydrolase family protein [Saccharopolyspora karakumensis]|uniref:hypothetical protein n=1 Tax=Saccharopolyspora karakumensis TaxID=2530386 RepID=UPI0038B492EC